MNVQQEFDIVLSRHLLTLGRKFPPYKISRRPFALIVQQTRDDIEKHELEWLKQDCSRLTSSERRAKLEEAAQEVVYYLEEPPSGLSFVADWFDQTSMLPRLAYKQLGHRMLAREVCPGIRLTALLDEKNYRWFEQVLQVNEPATADEAELINAVVKFMKKRVVIEPLGEGAFVVTGHYNDVALMAFDQLPVPKVNGAPVALRLGGNRLFFAGADDRDALERIAMSAQEMISTRSGPMVPDGQPLRFSDGKWKRWLPPRKMSRARSAFVEVRRSSVEAQYYHQAKFLSVSLPDQHFAPIARLSVAGDRLSVCRWIEGRESVLPIADAYTLVPKSGSGALIAGEDMVKLAELGCLGALSYDEQTLLSPLRLATARFPTAAELKNLKRYSPDPLRWWEFDES